VIGYRRSPTLVSYWTDDGPTIANYDTRRRAVAAPVVLDLLTYCGGWRTFSDVATAFPDAPSSKLRELLGLLTELSFLQRGRVPRVEEAHRWRGWRSWSPEAALFHFGTKDVRYDDRERLQAELVARARTQPPPPAVKRYPREGRLALLEPRDVGSLETVLRMRRTWRAFGDAPVDAGAIASLLQHTWGVQGWVRTDTGPVALKTAPSGGARHPIDVYLLARRVTGIAAGAYYYDPDAHDLVPVRRGLRRSTLTTYLGNQEYFGAASAVFVMTAAFGREMWRYDSPRAYRVVLLDAGHLCQTFCLVATALGLAPFSTAALADSRIERDLGIDGVNESVIYACGVGTRPAGVTWAPWVDSAPEVRPSRWQARAGAARGVAKRA
jgi:SagB-type dehydrogenase family enzyme